MKNKTNKSSILALCVFALSFGAQAQFPNFTKVDTGAITQLWGGHGMTTCFDMDNDGDLDLFVGNSAVGITRIFSIFKNERNGFYIEMPEFITNLDFGTVSSFGDIDNDGDADLFAGLPYNTMRVYPNNGYGDFQAYTTVSSPDIQLYPILLDLNSDGFLDLVAIDRWGTVCYNNGNGGFLAWQYLGLFQQQQNVTLHGVSWGDVDDDGDFDFFGGYSPNNEYGIPINLCYLNDGNGNFVQFDPTSIICEGECSTSCPNWVDYDNDGDMDLYVNNVACDNSLSALYENLGDMQFTKHVIVDEIYQYTLAVSTVWGDLDNDADLDLFITVENNPLPWPPYDTSATPFNILYLNDGNGQFTEFLDEQHPLVNEDTHTALLLDHDNDGDLDVLMSRYSWSWDGYDNLFVNEGNDNSWMVLTCEGTTSNRTAIGTRVQAKCFVNGNHITQTREITPIHGHLSYANLRVHFGLREADVIDTLIIRWPSGIVDTYLDVEANQFYRAIENQGLSIEFKATNYIAFTPGIHADSIYQTTAINLKNHFHLMTGDTIPQIAGDTLTFSVYNDNNPGIVQAEVNGSFIILKPLAIGETTIEILASAGFTEKLSSVVVNVVDLPPSCLPDGITFSTQEEIDDFQTNHPSCVQIEGDVRINGNDINNLDALSVITAIWGDLKIISNDILTGLSGLDNVTFIDGNLEIIGNPVLSDIAELSKIESATINDLSIFYNFDLSECDIWPICQYLSETGAIAEIHDNATECNSIEEVQEHCLTEIEEHISEGKLNIYPNPSGSKTIITYTLKNSSAVTLKILDLTGWEMATLVNEFQQQGEQQVIFNGEGLKSGIYFCMLKTNEGTLTKKIIKL